MEYDFIYDRDSRRYRMKLATEQAALQLFLLEEFEHDARAYQRLITRLQTVRPYENWFYQGREFSLTLQHGEVQVCHNSLLTTEGMTAGVVSELALVEDLSLDEQGLMSECGLPDLLILLQAWQAFLTR